jgi:type III secretory pathway component EscS
LGSTLWLCWFSELWAELLGQQQHFSVIVRTVAPVSLASGVGVTIGLVNAISRKTDRS